MNDKHEQEQFAMQDNYKDLNIIRLTKELKKTRAYLISVIMLLVIVISTACFVFAFWTENEDEIHSETSSSEENTQIKSNQEGDISVREAIDKIKLAYILVKNNYYENKTNRELSDAFLKGGMKSLGSPYSNYLTAKEFADFLEHSSGKYYGIGVSLEATEEGKPIKIEDFQGFQIRQVTKGSPADKAGIKNEDYIISVNGKTVDNYKNVSEMAKEVRGEKNTKVELEIYRPSTKKKIKFSVERDNINQLVVESKIIGDVAYIRLYAFTNNLHESLLPHLKKVKENKIKKIIFDLRYNGGGDAAQLRLVLNEFIKNGPIASIEGRSNGKAYKEVWEVDNHTYFDYPVHYAALVNRHTASASEFFVGAMRDRLNMPIFGEKTFGKGVATSSVPLQDGSALAITTFEYILPNGEKVNDKGIVPEYVIKDEANKSKDPSQIKLQDDKVLNSALDYMKGVK